MDLTPLLYALAAGLALSIPLVTTGVVVMLLRRQGRWLRSPAGRIASSANPTQSTLALEVYKELAKDKLEVIKTALAMGYKDEEIARLDARLESLIGKDKLEVLLKGGSPEALASADLLDTQLESEMQRLKQIQGSK